MIRATWDTNALASGAIARQGILAILMDRWRRGDFELEVSEHILTELERTLRKPYFNARLPASEREEFLNALRDIGTIVSIAELIATILSDRADNLVLATAISAGSSYVVSGDRQILSLGAFQGVRNPSARAFFELISQPPSGA